MHKLFLDFKRGIMELKQYIIESSRTCPDLGLDFNNQMHMAIGISTEAGELLDAYKKKLAYNKSLDKTNVAEEIGDLCWYVANLCRILNLDLQEILQNNYVYCMSNCTRNPNPVYKFDWVRIKYYTSNFFTYLKRDPKVAWQKAKRKIKQWF